MRPIDRLHTFIFQPPPHANPLPEEEERSSTVISTSLEIPEAEDFLQFGREWPKIRPHLHEDLESLIAVQRNVVETQKELFRPIIEQEKLGEAQTFYDELEYTLSTGTIQPSKLGGGGVYILYNALDQPAFVIKPEDEAILCLNNPKHRGSPFNDPFHRLRDEIPLYKTCETEVSVSAIAKEIGIKDCTPETRLMIISSSLFYDLSTHLRGLEKEEFIAKSGLPNREKLCSVQRFVSESLDLRQAMHEWFEAGLEEQFPLPIDQEAFEDVMLLLWIVYDTDGHSSNFRLFFKGLDEDYSAIYGIKKIDNGLSLPENNRYFLNYLGYLQNAKNAPSKRLLEKVAAIDEGSLCAILDRFHLSYAKTALRDRIDVLKSLTQRPLITLEEINLRFEFLNLPNGKTIALSPLSLQEITDSLQMSSEPTTWTKTSSRKSTRIQDHPILIKV